MYNHNNHNHDTEIMGHTDPEPETLEFPAVNPDDYHNAYQDDLGGYQYVPQDVPQDGYGYQYDHNQAYQDDIYSFFSPSRPIKYGVDYDPRDPVDQYGVPVDVHTDEVSWESFHRGAFGVFVVMVVLIAISCMI